MWEHTVIRLSNDGNLKKQNEELKAMGELGWELVTVVETQTAQLLAYFKRTAE